MLDRTAISDAGLAKLGGLTALNLLSIGSTNVADTGLAHLKALTSLKRLLGLFVARSRTSQPSGTAHGEYRGLISYSSNPSSGASQRTELFHMSTSFTCGHRGAASAAGPSGLGGKRAFAHPGRSPTPELTEIAMVAVSTTSGTTTLMVQVSTFPVSW